MKLSGLLIPAALLPVMIPFVHEVATAPLGDIDVEAAASQRILELQAQYQQNILDTVSNRTSGCTAQNIQRRQEWYVLPLH